MTTESTRNTNKRSITDHSTKNAARSIGQQYGRTVRLVAAPLRTYNCNFGLARRSRMPPGLQRGNVGPDEPSHGVDFVTARCSGREPLFRVSELTGSMPAVTVHACSADRSRCSSPPVRNVLFRRFEQRAHERRTPTTCRRCRVHVPRVLDNPGIEREIARPAVWVAALVDCSFLFQ